MRIFNRINGYNPAISLVLNLFLLLIVAVAFVILCGVKVYHTIRRVYNHVKS